MGDATAAVQQAQSAATPAAPAAVQPAKESPQAKLDRQIASAQEKLRQSELSNESEKPEPAAKPAPAAGKKPTPPKDARGKFVSAAKVKAEAESVESQPDASSPEPASKDTPPPTSPRALLKQGKLEEAFKAAFGEDVDPRQFQISSKQWTAFRHEVKAERQKLATRAEQIEAKAGEYVKRFEPFAEAQRLYDAGDLAGMVKVITRGEMDASEFNRRLLHSQYNRDPAVERLERELKAEKEQRLQRERDAEVASERQRIEQEQAQYREQMAVQLAESEDPRIARAAKRPAFIRAVFKLQLEHYDPHSNTTLPMEEAAQMVLEQVYSDHTGWSEVFNGAGQPQKSEIPNQGGTAPAKSGVVKTTPKTLRQSEAAEAAPRTKLSREQLLLKYEQQMRQSSFE